MYIYIYIHIYIYLYTITHLKHTIYLVYVIELIMYKFIFYM